MSHDRLSPEMDAFAQGAVRIYLFLGFGSLVLSWLLLMERVAFGGLGLMVLLLGSLGLLPFLIPPKWGWLSRVLRRPFPATPGMVFFTVAVIETLFGETPFASRQAAIPVEDLLIIVSLLAYAAAQYRLFALGHRLIPTDPRPHPLRLAGDAPEVLPGDRVRLHELQDMIGTLGLTVALAFVTWVLIAHEPILPDELASDQLRLSGTARRILLLLWITGLTVVLAGQVVHLFRWLTMTRDEARMILHEEVWSETRREQRRIARWLAWHHRRIKPSSEETA